MSRQVHSAVAITVTALCLVSVIAVVVITASAPDHMYSAKLQTQHHVVDTEHETKPVLCMPCPGPSLGLDGKLRLLPSIVPGIGL